ncbi:hypothetical protein [Galbibacter sp. BG1]
MNYYLDTEFIEGSQKKWFGKTKPTIDLISIGIVCEDGREYYAISKDFNLKEAWNRYDLKLNKRYPIGPEFVRDYWIRNNVLKPVFIDLLCKERVFLRVIWNNRNLNNDIEGLVNKDFTYNRFKDLLKKYGKSNEEIAGEVVKFVCPDAIYNHYECKPENLELPNQTKINFYTYYGDYDWVFFCWLFGRMIDLPKGFPMYSKDLKQMLDEKSEKYVDSILKEPIVSSDWHDNYCVDEIKRHPDYPKQENEHNALADAKWNKKLHEFLNKIV